MESSSAAAARRRAELLTAGRDAHDCATRLLAELGTDGTGLLDDVGPGAAADLRTLDGQLAVLGGLLRERLRDLEHPLAQARVASVSETLHEVHTVRFSIHDLLGHERLRRFDELDRGLGELRRYSDQDALLSTVCEAAANAGGFERVMLSRVDDDIWRPWHSFARTLGEPEQSFLEWMRDEPTIQLSHMLLESEMVRRRTAVIVYDATIDSRVYRPLAESAGQRSYVAAPLISDGRVIGLLHADNAGAPVDELDRDVLWFFAIGFAQVFERAVLLARLRDQRAEVMAVLKGVDDVLDELASTEIELATRSDATAVGLRRPLRPPATERPAALENVLTSRELEVLALMATGATNERIAQRLVIATGTVKTHVKQILRKLRVENRAEAISQYLRLTIGARED